MKYINQADMSSIWKAFFLSKESGQSCPKLKRKLVEHYYELVHRVAQRMHKRLSEITTDELSSIGVDGLYQAIEGYDPNHEKKSKFETYAMHRISGSMLDGIRKSDWVPRLVRSNATWLDKQRSVHESAAGRKLRNEELWERIDDDAKESRGIKLDIDFEEYIRGATTTAMHSVNDMQSGSDSESRMSIEHIKDNRAVQPIERILRKELFHKLMGKNFTPQERSVIWLYYFENTSMKEISNDLGISESRVSQMHCEIQLRLQQKAERNPEYFSDIWEMISEFKETYPVT